MATVHPGLASYGLAAVVLRFRVVTERLEAGDYNTRYYNARLADAARLFLQKFRLERD
jgi:hypothetical protein